MKTESHTYSQLVEPLTLIRSRTRFYLHLYNINVLREELEVVQHLRPLLLKDQTVQSVVQQLIFQQVHELYAHGRTEKITENIQNQVLLRKIINFLSTVIRQEYRLIKTQINHIVIDQQLQHGTIEKSLKQQNRNFLTSNQSFNNQKGIAAEKSWNHILFEIQGKKQVGISRVEWGQQRSSRGVQADLDMREHLSPIN